MNLFRNRFDKKANEAQILQNKLAQAKAQIDKLTGDLMRAHDDKDKLTRDNTVWPYIDNELTMMHKCYK